MLSRAVLFSFLLVCLSFAQLGFPNGSLPTISQPSTGTRSLLLNRNQAYYLGSIPPPASSLMLWLIWNASFPTVSSGMGLLQFSQNGSDWSNLVSFRSYRVRLAVGSPSTHLGQEWARTISGQSSPGCKLQSPSFPSSPTTPLLCSKYSLRLSELRSLH